MNELALLATALLNLIVIVGRKESGALVFSAACLALGMPIAFLSLALLFVLAPVALPLLLLVGGLAVANVFHVVLLILAAPLHEPRDL